MICVLRRISILTSARSADNMKYIYQYDQWPNFNWQDDVVNAALITVRYHQGHLIGRMEALGFDFRGEAVLTTLTNDVLNLTK